MSGPLDLRDYKTALRIRYRNLRKAMTPAVKHEKDNQILTRLLAMPIYQECRLLLTYVSTPEEVDTHALIAHALKEGKTVAVPYCVAGTREMVFYAIRSVQELVPRSYGELEPIAKEEDKITDFAHSLCVLPGVVFDQLGYRLGYGGGYYDRFLADAYPGKTVGLCYQDCIVSRLRRGRYDMACDYVVTENGFFKQ
jgi:5-formyltetrahydrofolate cyclo-ligase